MSRYGGYEANLDDKSSVFFPFLCNMFKCIQNAIINEVTDFIKDIVVTYVLYKISNFHEISILHAVFQKTKDFSSKFQFI